MLSPKLVVLGRSQDFICEICGSSMCSALLTLSPNSSPSAEEHGAKELAQQIRFKVQTARKDKWYPQ